MPQSSELARRLVMRASRRPDAKDAATRTQAACEETYRELSRWLGAAGAHALLTRALVEARSEHAALGEIRAGPKGEIFAGIDRATEKHGGQAVAAALEVVLVTLLDLLGRLIGSEMVARLLDADGTGLDTEGAP